MGFFSKTCAKTHLPVCTMYKERPFFSAVVALTADGQVIEGVYDVNGDLHRLGDPDEDGWRPGVLIGKVSMDL
jgi:hypothetical protein